MTDKIGPGTIVEIGKTPAGTKVTWYMGFGHEPHIAILTADRDRIIIPPQDVEPLIALLVMSRTVKGEEF